MSSSMRVIHERICDRCNLVETEVLTDTAAQPRWIGWVRVSRYKIASMDNAGDATICTACNLALDAWLENAK